MRKLNIAPSRLAAFTLFTIYFLSLSALATTAKGDSAPTPGPTEEEPRVAPRPSGSISGPETGTLLLCGVKSPTVIAEFTKRAGGADAKIVMIVKQVPAGMNPIDAGAKAAKAWGVRQVTFWVLKDRQSAKDEALLSAIKNATGVWLPGGKPLEYVGPLLDTDAHRELKELLARGGVIGGESAGAVALSSFIVLPPGSPHAGPALEGLGFAMNLAIFPHFGTSGKFRRDFCEGVIAQQAGVIGIAMPDGSAVVIRRREVQVVGQGAVSLLTRSSDGTVTTTAHTSGSSFTLPEQSSK